MQWADASLLDFIEYLLEWSRNSPIFVVTLARPELLERRPTWGAGQRNFTSLYLEPLSPEAMEELLDGLVPGPARRASRRRSSPGPRASRCTRSRRCGCCSTAALLVQEGPVYRPTGPIECAGGAGDAARADRRAARRPRGRGAAAAPGRRRPRQDVHARRRSAALAGSGGRARAAARLARPQGGARRPGRSALARARPVRVPPGPRPARRLRDAFEARAPRPTPGRGRVPRARPCRTRTRSSRWSPRTTSPRTRQPPTPTTRRDREQGAQRRSSRAGERAASLAAAGEAQRYFEQARRARRRAVGRARSCSSAPGGWPGRPATRTAARALLDERSTLYEARGRHARGGPGRRAARRVDAVTRAASTRRSSGWSERLRSSPTTSRTRTSAPWPHGSAGYCAISGDLRARGRARRAGARHRRGAPHPRGVVARSCSEGALRAEPRTDTRRRRVLLKQALQLALEHDLRRGDRVDYFNLSDHVLPARPLRRRARIPRRGARARASARQRSVRDGRPRPSMTYPLYMLGRWDEALAAAPRSPGADRLGRGSLLSLLSVVVAIQHRARRSLDEAPSRARSSRASRPPRTSRTSSPLPRSRGDGAAGRGTTPEALRCRRAGLGGRAELGSPAVHVKQGSSQAIEAALALGDTAKAEELLAASRHCRRDAAAVPRRPRAPLPRAAGPATRPASEPRPSDLPRALRSRSGSRSRCSSTES